VRMTTNGADCVLADGRLVTIAGVRAPLLVWAERTTGQSFADEQPVTFTIYRLTNDDLEDRRVFRKVKSLTTSAKYCDVGEAFGKELPAMLMR
jgi:hypothetical protein